jgi:hypothetical protein
MSRKAFYCLVTLQLVLGFAAPAVQAAAPSTHSTGSAQAGSGQSKPNILVIWGDDIGYWNPSYINHGMMGYKTPNIDRIANEGLHFTDYYGEQSCTAGRAAFITGQIPVRTGNTKVGMPGAPQGLQKGSHHRRVAQAAGLHDRPVRQEPSGRPQRILPDRPWF